jgi:hypothetical protein
VYGDNYTVFTAKGNGMRHVFGEKSCNDREVELVLGVNSKIGEQSNEKWRVFKESVFRKNLVLHGNAFM